MFQQIKAILAAFDRGDIDERWLAFGLESFTLLTLARSESR